MSNLKDNQYISRKRTSNDRIQEEYNLSSMTDLKKEEGELTGNIKETYRKTRRNDYEDEDRPREKYDDYYKRMPAARKIREPYEEDINRTYSRNKRRNYDNYEDEMIKGKNKNLPKRYGRDYPNSEEEDFERRNYREKEREYKEREREYDQSQRRLHDQDQPIMKKKFNFLMVLPKNYFRFLEQDYHYIISDIKKRIRDLEVFQIDYKVSYFPEFLLRIEAPKVSDKAYALKMVCDFLFDCMKQTFKDMYYLKVTILVPSHVVGFIIGIEGKNINNIRDISGARIEVFQNDVAHKFRQIELQGSPDSISKASEKIYKIVNKYYFFNGQSEEMNRREEEEDLKRRRVKLGNRRRVSVSRSKSPNHNEKDEEKRKSRKTKITNNKRSLSRQDKNEVVIIRKNSEQITTNLTKNEIVPLITNQIQNNTIENIPILPNYINIPPILTNSSTVIQPTHLNIPILNESQPQLDENKVPLSIIITNQHLNLLKNIKGNIFIEIENKYHCSISKKVEKLSNSDVNILTLSGTPEQNSMAIYSLQQAMLGKSDIFNTGN